jgi:hypothetical protein
MGDPSPLEAGDHLFALGAFGAGPGGLIVFHAITETGPAGGAIFARQGGSTFPVAIAGTARPASGVDAPVQPWSGFQTIEMNNEGAFLFTDFQGLVRLGLFMGRLVPAPGPILDALRARVPTLALAPADTALLLSRLDSIERFAAVDGGGQALKLAMGVQRAIRSKAGTTIPELAADALDPLLEDLVVALTPPPPAQLAMPARFDSIRIDR